jgi:hypothetical protein
VDIHSHHQDFDSSENARQLQMSVPHSSGGRACVWLGISASLLLEKLIGNLSPGHLDDDGVHPCRVDPETDEGGGANVGQKTTQQLSTSARMFGPANLLLPWLQKSKGTPVILVAATDLLVRHKRRAGLPGNNCSRMVRAAEWTV